MSKTLKKSKKDKHNKSHRKHKKTHHKSSNKNPPEHATLIPCVKSETGIIKFIMNFNEYFPKIVKDKTVQIYMQIFGIDMTKFIELNEDYGIELGKLVKQLVKYPKICREFFKYIRTGKSKLDFLRNYSAEQIRYITNPDVVDTKVIACAGSGKTRSVIGRVKFLAEHQLVPKEDIYSITFSKLAKGGFHEKIILLFPDHEEFCDIQNFSTIDSLAKSILCRVKSHKSENVEILSIAFRNFLKEITPESIEIVREIKNIKHLFVDEAQDLNEVQYDILMLLKNKFGTVIELIGDPNQNIFQFRRSSGKYLINFNAKFYELTLNFRSTQQIIDFSEGFKPIPTARSVSATNKMGPNVTILTKSLQEMHNFIINFIIEYQKTKDISNIAIICPTRGIKSYDNIGLSVFFNLFKMKKIPFSQLYDESGTSTDRQRSVEKKDGHINLITYHGTKGLEFDVVFVMDFYQHLFNIKPTEEDHNVFRYLLYVATSRAISQMFVCTYINSHGGYMNHWLTYISPEYYQSDQQLKIPKLSFRDNDGGNSVNGITELINKMTDEQLNMIDDVIKINEGVNSFTRRIYKDHSNIDRGKDEILFGLFTEELFYSQYSLSKKMIPRELAVIKMIIDKDLIIIESDSDLRIIKTYVVANKLTWEKYDLTRNSIPEHVRKLIEKYFKRDQELNRCIVCNGEFSKIIDDNVPDIKKTYNRYLDPNLYEWNYRKIMEDLFYLVVVQYAYDINHYYYVENHGKGKIDVLNCGMEMYESMNNYIENNYIKLHIDCKIDVTYEKLMLIGEIDFIERYANDDSETIVEIKCAKEICIKYYVQLLLYNFCYFLKKGELNKIFHNKFKILNLLTGLEHYLILSIDPTNMFNVLIVLAQHGNLKFNRMNLVFDLETTGKINNLGPLDHKPSLNRAIIHYSTTKRKYFAEVIPEIIEIAIKDYDTGMILLNTLVQPTECKKLDPEVEKLTGITDAMLLSAPLIDDVRKVLTRKMDSFTNYHMMAHNCLRFDSKIILWDKLVDHQRVNFLDTMSIIPIHLDTDVKAEAKSLGELYKMIIGKNFNAHRAMADVNALITIMNKLRIKF